MLPIRENSRKDIYISDRKQISVSGCLGLGRGGLHTCMRDLLCDENVSMLILVVAT